jgi:predicted dehydrogenase
MKTTYRAAISGLGNIAWLFDHNNKKQENIFSHAFSYLNNSKTTLIGGYSPDKSERQAFADAIQAPVYETPEFMISCEKPDIVSICSPSEFHFEQVMYCLECEIPMIWLEKPPAASLDELDKMLALQSAKGGKSKILVNYQRRYTKRYQDLKNLYSRKELGSCHLIQINYSRGLELNGSHMLDILFYITGDSEDYTLEWVSTSGNPENPCFALSLKDGPEVMISGAGLTYHNIDISLTCDQGRESILHGGTTTVYEQRIEQEMFPGFYNLKKESRNKDPYVENGMEMALNDLIDAHEQNREPLSNLTNARQTQVLMEKIRTWQKRKK